MKKRVNKFNVQDETFEKKKPERTRSEEKVIKGKDKHYKFINGAFWDGIRVEGQLGNY